MTEIHIITQEGDSSQIEKKQYKLLPIEVGADGIATSGVIEMENLNTGDTEYAEINPIQGSPNHFKVTEVQKQTE